MIISDPHCFEPRNRYGCVCWVTLSPIPYFFFHCVNNLTEPSKECADIAVQKQSWTCVTLPGCGLHFLPCAGWLLPVLPLTSWRLSGTFQERKTVEGGGKKGGLSTAHLTRNRHSTRCQNTVLRGSQWLRSGSGKTILWEDQVSEGGEAFPVGDATQAACFIMLGFSKIWKYIKSLMLLMD